MARVAEKLRIPYCVATQSTTSIERIRQAAPDAQLWFQSYLWNDLDLSFALLERARAQGVRTLVVTVDTPTSPGREYNRRNGFSVPFRPTVKNVLDMAVHPGWCLKVLAHNAIRGGVPAYAHYPSHLRGNVFRASSQAVGLRKELGWDTIARVRDAWQGRILLKGVLCPEDAVIAAERGLDGIIVSSHGGRNLDCAPAPVEVLPLIRNAVGARLTILADSGVQRGADVVKYCALGADAVLTGRAALYGLAAGGFRGASRMMEILKSEMENLLILSGRRSPAESVVFAPDHRAS